MSAKAQKAEETRKLVREKYREIATGRPEPGAGCGCCPSPSDEITDLGEDYGGREGYVPEANLGLGCGLPTDHAGIRPGDTVFDLGSGAGNDVFVARSLVGDEGRVVGVDMTEEMNRKARANARKLGHGNVEFRLGEIEALPARDEEADVVISNCVLNLVPDKAKAYREIHRVLRPGGRFCISDIVSLRSLPAEIRSASELYVGCVAGASLRSDYLRTIEEAGFREIAVLTERPIELPDEVLRSHLGRRERAAFRRRGPALLSVTVSGRTPEGATSVRADEGAVGARG